MAEELQSLLDKIQREGFSKAEEEGGKIVSDANAQAEKIVADAKKRAEEIVKKAKADADSFKERGEETLRLASRDIVINLKTELLSRLRNLVRSCSADAMTPQVMGEIILEMAKKYMSGKGDGDEAVIKLMFPENELEKMETLLKGGLLKDLKANPQIRLGSDFGAGFKIGFGNDDVFFDFIDEVVADILCSYAGPKIAELIQSHPKG